MRSMKDFDCVQMKSDIQDMLLEEEERLGKEEAERRRAERLQNDRILPPSIREKLIRTTTPDGRTG
jgi:hypothetical protein